MPSIQGQVGPQILGTSSVQATPSMSPNGGLITQDEHGRFYEAVRRGGVYTLSTAAAGITVAAGNVSPLTANTGIPIIGLFNPVNSGYNLVIMRTKIQTVSGTPGGGFVWNVVAPNDPITVTPGSKGINNKTFVQGGVAIGFSNSAFTGSVVGTMFRPIGGTAAIVAGAGVYSVDEITDGDIVIPPGGFAGIAATAAGTTHVVAAAVTWEEVIQALPASVA